MHSKQELIDKLINEEKHFIVRLLPNVLDNLYIYSDGSSHSQIAPSLVGKYGTLMYNWEGSEAYDFVMFLTDDFKVTARLDQEDRVVSIASLDAIELIDVDHERLSKQYYTEQDYYFTHGMNTGYRLLN